MSDSNTLFLGASLLIIAMGIGWVLLRRYLAHQSRIDEALRAIRVTLSEMPKEINLQEYMFSQDQQLRSIGEKLDTYPDPALLLQHIQDHTQQWHSIVAMLAAGSQPELTRADLENSLRAANDSLAKVLWSLRFDEDKYAESTAAAGSRFADSPRAKGKSDNEKKQNGHLALNDAKTMKSILKNSNDDYRAMLEYMQQTGKSGSHALQALNTAAGSHNR